jgi:hypothetical protein
MDPRSRKARELALSNLQHIQRLIEQIQKRLPPKIVPKPREQSDFYKVKEVD